MNGLNLRVALRIARKDNRVFLKERGTLIYLFVLPIVFILAFSSATSGGSDPQKQAITLPVINLDAGSKSSQILLDELGQGGGIQCELYEEAEAWTLLDKEKITRLLTIPANYETDLQAGIPVALRLTNNPGASQTQSEAVHRVVAGVAADLSLEMQLIASFRQMADMEAAAPLGQRAFTADIVVEQAQSQFERSRTEPLLVIEENWPAHLQEDEEEINPLSVYVPGFTVLFIFLTAQTTAQSIYDEKKVGSFRRLVAAPITRGTILVGKIAPNFIIGLAQIVVLFGAGVFLVPLLGLDRMTLGNDPLALVLVCLAILLCATSLGVLIVAIARTEGQISGLSAVVLWAFGFAGMMVSQMPSTSFVDTVRQVIPQCWANTALLDLFVRGLGLSDVMPSILALLGFTVAFFAVGLWRFKFD